MEVDTTTPQTTETHCDWGKIKIYLVVTFSDLVSNVSWTRKNSHAEKVTASQPSPRREKTNPRDITLLQL